MNTELPTVIVIQVLLTPVFSSLQVSEDRQTFRKSHPADSAGRPHHLHSNLGFPPGHDELLHHPVLPHPGTFDLRPSEM